MKTPDFDRWLQRNFWIAAAILAVISTLAVFGFWSIVREILW